MSDYEEPSIRLTEQLSCWSANLSAQMSLVSQLDHQIKQLQQLKAEWERQIAAQYPEFNSCYRQVAELEYRFNQEGEDPTTPFRQS